MSVIILIFANFQHKLENKQSICEYPQKIVNPNPNCRDQTQASGRNEPVLPRPHLKQHCGGGEVEEGVLSLQTRRFA
jgi:hypothetical protein